MLFAGLPCDVGVGSSGARFKSRVLGLLDAADRRFGQLLRLVKAWARAHSFNAPAEGTFNTFALCLMVRCSSTLAGCSSVSTHLVGSSSYHLWAFNPQEKFLEVKNRIFTRGFWALWRCLEIKLNAEGQPVPQEAAVVSSLCSQVKV